MHEVVFSRIIVVVVALTTGLVSADSSVAQTAPSQPGGSASISYPPGEQSTPGSNTLNVPSGTTVVTVSWDASCPPYSGDSDPQDWSWSITVNGTYRDGRDAFDSGYIGPGLGRTSWHGHQGFGVSMEHAQDESDTIGWEVQLHCGSATTDPMTLGSGSFTLTKCDPDSYAKAQSEFALAEKLQAAADRELAEAENADEELHDETVKEGDTIALVSASANTALSLLEHFKYVTGYGAVAVEIADALIAIVNLAEQVDLNNQNWSRLNDGARTDLEQAKTFTDRGDADLAAAFGGGCPDPDQQLNKLLADQRRDDDARKLIESWENNGYLYRSPITHEALDQAAALTQAKTALAQAKTALSGDPSNRRATDRAASASVTASTKELRAAIIDLDTAIGYNKSVRSDLSRLEAATTTALNGLRALLAT